MVRRAISSKQRRATGSPPSWKTKTGTPSRPSFPACAHSASTLSSTQSPTKTTAFTLRRPGLGHGVLQHLADLRLAGAAHDPRHPADQRLRIRQPGARLEFAEAAIPGELDLEPAQRLGGREHLALDAAGAVPARLAAGGGVHREDQPAHCPPVRTAGIDLTLARKSATAAAGVAVGTLGFGILPGRYEPAAAGSSDQPPGAAAGALRAPRRPGALDDDRRRC